MRATYILPIKASDARRAPELAAYLASLEDLQIIIVDGSPDRIFEEHGAHLRGALLHVPPACDISGANGKTRGVLTGLRYAACDKIIVADDDVRHDRKSIDYLLKALESTDAVLPQNYFEPAPWHAILDTSRTLLNRVTGGDWPGTIAFRKSLLPFGYNADVLFENYEMVRTIASNGGRILRADDCYVKRRPPTFQQYRDQRIRQAYDELARPRRLALQLAILPLCLALWALRLRPLLLAGALLSIAAAEVGRRKSHGKLRFSPLASAAVPIWILERGICSWLAMYSRVRHGGIRYAGAILASAASPKNASPGAV